MQLIKKNVHFEIHLNYPNINFPDEDWVWSLQFIVKFIQSVSSIFKWKDTYICHFQLPLLSSSKVNTPVLFNGFLKFMNSVYALLILKDIKWLANRSPNLEPRLKKKKVSQMFHYRMDLDCLSLMSKFKEKIQLFLKVKKKKILTA